MYFIGIDIGSTASKTAVMQNGALVHHFVMPTGWSSKETADKILAMLAEKGINPGSEGVKTIATGYGRISVPYADKVMSEITCHGIGGQYLFGDNATIVDIGGQDTKVITVKNGKVTDFLMNDKCSAGTGKFVEVMANRLGVDMNAFNGLAKAGTPITISSMCTVFAESEIISHIGKGTPREDIARGVVESITAKVASLCNKHGLQEACFLTGGLCECPILLESLSRKLNREVQSKELGRFAGAIGAAILAEKKIG